MKLKNLITAACLLLALCMGAAAQETWYGSFGYPHEGKYLPLHSEVIKYEDRQRTKLLLKDGLVKMFTLNPKSDLSQVEKQLADYQKKVKADKDRAIAVYRAAVNRELLAKEGDEFTNKLVYSDAYTAEERALTNQRLTQLQQLADQNPLYQGYAVIVHDWHYISSDTQFMTVNSNQWAKQPQYDSLFGLLKNVLSTRTDQKKKLYTPAKQDLAFSSATLFYPESNKGYEIRFDYPKHLIEVTYK